jgi:hypothetical protein
MFRWEGGKRGAIQHFFEAPETRGMVKDAVENWVSAQAPAPAFTESDFEAMVDDGLAAAKQQEAQAELDTSDIPPRYLLNTQVPVDVWIEDEGRVETVQMSAQKALDDTRAERDAYQKLMDCLKGAD